MSTIVYAVYSYEYDEMALEGIFSTKEKAQEFIDTCGIKDIDLVPQEIVVDEWIGYTMRPIYTAIVRLDTGEIAKELEWIEQRLEKADATRPEYRPYELTWWPLWNGTKIDIYKASSLISMEHAEELALEYYKSTR